MYRLQQLLKKKLIGSKQTKVGNFSQFIQASAYDERLTYQLPDHVKETKASWW